MDKVKALKCLELIRCCFMIASMAGVKSGAFRDCGGNYDLEACGQCAQIEVCALVAEFYALYDQLKKELAL